MKIAWIVFLFMNIYTVNIYAYNSLFVWHNTEIEVPLNANIETFLDIPYATMIDGYKDSNLYYEKNGINYTFISTINTSIVRTYRLDFKVTSPKYLKSSTQTITIHVKDMIPPVLMKGFEMDVPVGTTKFNILDYIDYKDNYDRKQDITVLIDQHAINYNQIGTYHINVMLTDKSKNTASTIIKVNVKDYQAPVIIEKENPVINVFEDLKLDLFYIIKDNYDQSPIIIIDDGMVDYHNIGTYPLTIVAIDQSNNESILRTSIQIKDTINPVLALKTTQVTMSLNDTLDLKSIILKASDNYDNLTINDVIIQTDLNSTKIGFYEAIYDLTDKSLNKTSVKVHIYVRDIKKPIVYIEDIMSQNYHQIDLMGGIEIQEQHRYQLHLLETNLENRPGSYQALYLIVDQYGNHTYHLRNITLLKDTSYDKPVGLYIYYVCIGLIGLGVSIFYYLYKRHNKKSRRLIP